MNINKIKKLLNLWILKSFYISINLKLIFILYIYLEKLNFFIFLRIKFFKGIYNHLKYLIANIIYYITKLIISWFFLLSPYSAIYVTLTIILFYSDYILISILVCVLFRWNKPPYWQFSLFIDKSKSEIFKSLPKSTI